MNQKEGVENKAPGPFGIGRFWGDADNLKVELRTYSVTTVMPLEVEVTFMPSVNLTVRGLPSKL
jgi:hypothetical protein